MAEDYILETRGITKRFPGVLANDHVDLAIRCGEIHALLGENGAGKSTLMNILYGFYQPNEGQILLHGKPVVIDSPKKALHLGIGMVHQHFMLIPNLTVLENVVLGLPSAHPPMLELSKIRGDVQAIFKRYNFEVDLDAMVRDISVGAQQRVEIVKALYRKVNLLILDEPTAVLTPQESVELFKVLHELKNQQCAIIFISHKIQEVMEISDRVSILRDGKSIATMATRDTTRQELARLMVGRDVSLTVEKGPCEAGETVLELKKISAKNPRKKFGLADVDLTVRQGEIVGIAGVDGNGQDELADLITGLVRPDGGSIAMFGKDALHQSTRELLDGGFAHIPADRRKYGMVMEFTIAENLMVHTHGARPLSKFGFLQRKDIQKSAQGLIKKYDIRTAGPQVLASNLSGGNQQKVVLCREFERDPKFLLVAQPTRGLDLGAREYVHEHLLEQRDKGTAILLISTDLEEVRALSDRLLVLYEGRIVGEVDPAVTEVEVIGSMMAGMNA